MSTMRCPKCGKHTIPGRFCEYCGESFYEADVQGERQSVCICNCGADYQPGAKYCHICGGHVQKGDVERAKNKEAKPKRKKILGWILFVWGILGVVAEVIFLIFFGFDSLFPFIRLFISGLFIWGGYTLKK